MSRPVRIVVYNPQWPVLYAEEKGNILRIIGHKVLAIEHIGSTAVPDLGGKPIIDIMAGVRHAADADLCVTLLQDEFNDVTPEPEEQDWYYCLGNHGQRERTYYVHLHLVKFMSEHWKRHLLFRDFLRTHPDTAQLYFLLKKELAAKYGSDRVGYTNAKTAFIESIIRQAHQRPDFS